MEIVKYILDDSARAILVIIIIAVIFGGIANCIHAFRSTSKSKDDESEI